MIAPALFAFALAVVGTWLLIRFAPRLGLIDRPNERSSHQAPTPRGGGIALVIATSAGLLLIPGGLPLAIRPALYAALPIAALGLIDDRFGLPARMRLSIHLAAAVACLLAFGAPFQLELSRLPLLALAAVSIAWGTNLFNFMDGIDGIAAAQGLFVSAVAAAFLAAQAPPIAAALAVIAATCAGFLIWNWAPARIFMGDVGSGFFGFLLAAVAVLTARQGLLALPVWLILWSTFIADTGVTLVRRILHGERWWTAHRAHAYQHLSRRTGNHARPTLLFATINLAVAMPAAFLAYSRPGMAWWTCGMLLLSLATVAHRIGAGLNGPSR